MAYTHKNLAVGGWQKLSFFEQLGNIGSEVGRAAKWQGKDEAFLGAAVSRALELFDLTLEDPRWRGRLREIARAREVFCDAVLGGALYKSTLQDLEHYFHTFAFRARYALLEKDQKLANSN